MATGSDRRWVKDLKPGTEIDEIYVVRSKDVRQRRGGGSYLSLTLGDRTGEVTGLVPRRCARGRARRRDGGRRSVAADPV